MLSEEFVGSEYPSGGSYAEKRALRIVDSLDVDCVDFVVVDYVHPVVAYTEHYEGEQRHHQATCGAAYEKSAAISRAIQICSGRNPTHIAVTASHTARAQTIISDSF